MTRPILLTFLCGLLAAQQSAPPTAQPPAQPGALQPAATPQDAPGTVFRTGIEVVQAPVLVFDKDGNFVDGLQAPQFHLFDNGKEQNINVDVAYQPISLVICLQANAHVEGVLSQVKKIGSLIEPLLIGEQGEAAVIAFDSRIRTLQDFTSDSDKITKAVSTIRAGSNANRMIDAVSAATRMLRTRPTNRRRIILYVGETRDNSSETRAREALLDLQYANVLFYPVDMSRLISTLSAKPDPGRQDLRPPAMHPMPSGVPATPTTVQQAYGIGGGGRAEFVPLMVEVFKDVKAIFKDNPVEVFTKGTGGTEYSFFKQRGLEDAIQKIGAELHSQYFVSYTPNNMTEGGFHTLEVVVGAYKTQTRPGYWLGTKY
ncbi:MAG: VWA domain-containing protein [Candidatus Solibacter sp.]